jgi:TolB-like protein/class 3 adenylate cyclase
MAKERVVRRLAAILAADVVGYSRLMGADEEGTLAALKTCRRELFDPKIAQYQGRIFKTTGDGALVEFASVVDAVRCALDIQRSMAACNTNIPEDRRIEFRIGINIGDIIIDEDDIYGDGVNVAARIEPLAERGAVCLSDSAYQQIKGKLPLDVTFMGEQQLKNIAQPIRVYSVHFDGQPTRGALSLPDKPSVAVLPFQNMSGDSEQEYFADGMVEDIITGLSRIKWLFVIARNSTFTYKGRAVDVKQIGRELGVRYVLEGSVRKAAGRVRVTGQLLDSSTGTHLWADRFESTLEDIFDLQDKVTTSVIGAIAPQLEAAEMERARRKPTESLDAYDYFLRGMASLYERNKEAITEALRLFYKAIELDPNFASAYGMASWCYAWRKINGWMSDRAHEIAETDRLARRAAELGPDDAVALSRAAHAIAFGAGDIDAATTFVDRALLLNPNLAGAWYASGWIRVWRGEPDMAIDHFAHGMRLSPLDPNMIGMQGGTAFAHFIDGRYDDASSWAQKGLWQQANYQTLLIIATASHALGGRLAEARQALAHLRDLNPALRVSNIKDWAPFSRPQDLARLADGLKKSGLPG